MRPMLTEKETKVYALLKDGAEPEKIAITLKITVQDVEDLSIGIRRKMFPEEGDVAVALPRRRKKRPLTEVEQKVSDLVDDGMDGPSICNVMGFSRQRFHQLLHAIAYKSGKHVYTEKQAESKAQMYLEYRKVLMGIVKDNPTIYFAALHEKTKGIVPQSVCAKFYAELRRTREVPTIGLSPRRQKAIDRIHKVISMWNEYAHIDDIAKSVGWKRQTVYSCIVNVRLGRIPYISIRPIYRDKVWRKEETQDA